MTKILNSYTALLISTEHVIPAKVGIQENTGFRVKPGMTNCTRFTSSCIKKAVLVIGDWKLRFILDLRFVIWDFKPVLDETRNHGVTVWFHWNSSPTY
jgi:hypothetical protein